MFSTAATSITLVVTLVTITLGFLAYRLLTRGERGAGSSAAADVAGFGI